MISSPCFLCSEATFSQFGVLLYMNTIQLLKVKYKHFGKNSPHTSVSPNHARRFPPGWLHCCCSYPNRGFEQRQNITELRLHFIQPLALRGGHVFETLYKSLNGLRLGRKSVPQCCRIKASIVYFTTSKNIFADW